MTPLFIRPAATLFLALLVVSNSSGTGSESSPQPRHAAAAGNHSAVAQPLTSLPSAENAAAPSSTVSVSVTLDVLNNRHAISPYVYGGAYPKDATTITDSGMTAVRWGGNATSTYNWQLFTNNAAADWYFEDFGYSEIGDADSIKYIRDVKAAGSNPLITMVMLPWVAKSAEGSGNGHWSFSIAKYGAECGVDPYNTDAGDGVKSDCSTNLTADPNDAYWPLLDQPGTGDPAGSVYRNQWAAALAAAFGSAPHFYDMDNEIDIWGSTHNDIHPNPSGYNELRDTYLTEARALKVWDKKAIRLGPVSCCWWFYWNGADNNDKGAHAGIDFLPWWLNEIYWQDNVAKTRSLDVFDIHAYPDAPDTSSLNQAQKQALTLRIYRDYWDPTYVSESSSINQNWATFLQPTKTIPFRLPRMRAIANMIYPGTPLSVTEWSAAFAGESDFSTALADADAYGILGRERVYLASRWVAPDPSNPNYLALKLYRNYDGAHSTFAGTSISAANTGDPNLFSSYAAVDSTGKILTVMVLNKDPGSTVQAQFALNGFTAQQVTTYALSATNPTEIVASSTQAWTPTLTFAPYSATMLVVSGTSQLPGVEWDLNPDTTMVAAGGKVVLHPKLVSGSATVTLGTPQSDSGITLSVTHPTLSPGKSGSITITAGKASGFYHYTVAGTDSTGVAQEQGGWILVGNPPASLSKTGDKQKGAVGTKLNLSVTLNPRQSGGSAAGATILFTASAGSLSDRTAVTDSSGTAAVVLTLPSSPGIVHVTAEGQYGLGHPTVTFTETAQ
jgi:Glycoside hydrolase family 44